MTFLQFRKQFERFLIFSLSDVRSVDPKFDRRRFSEWQEKGYITKLRRGFYVFSDLPINESVLFIFANEIYPPSYVSFESALSYYQFIPESVFAVTSATSKKTAAFTTPIGTFRYHTLKPPLMFGYTLLSYQDHKLKIAEPEKALLDYLYIHADLTTTNDFYGLRINHDQIRTRCRKRIIMRYLEAFKSESLRKRVAMFFTVYPL